MSLKLIFIKMLIIMVFMLLSVAFYTLMERKIMSINQFRLGPNKIFMMGLVQPIFDGFKLFLKQINSPKKNPLIFYFSPLISFIISMTFWSIFFSISLKFKNIIFLFFLGISVYSFVLSGWISFSKFGYLGGIRASSQTVSYEISLAILILLLIFFFSNFNFSKENEFFFYIFLIPIFYLWLFSIISETNRAPFDFSEGESELISGFNIEYGSSGFVLYFLSEYSMMIFFSFFSFLIFSLNFFFFFYMLFLLISFRTSFPRFRYDFLINFMWFKILPMSIFLLMFFIIF